MVLSFLKVTQESVRFRDVAVVFSSNQWVHLSFQERELYRDVMLDTCDYIASLGHWMFKGEGMSSLRQGKDPWMLEREVTSAPCPAACEPAGVDYHALYEFVDTFRQSAHHTEPPKHCSLIQRYECDDCTMAFALSSQLTGHRQIHQGFQVDSTPEHAQQAKTTQMWPVSEVLQGIKVGLCD
ncbi:putative zinc finger protein 840 [Sus scrofa]|uniref:putative zinc finger protein 840 n=1 Tax=Sus scrofa TaxID=9823 RepID=UPI000A2B2897|nr:putative zinc finger protein 840 [Sus scrofa]